jgi:putative mRNA 3-end processing factor
MPYFRTPPLVVWTEKGLYCPDGDFYIDPSRRVDTAVITHAHSDHARKGSRRYLCASSSVSLLQARLGHSISVLGIPYRQPIRLGSLDVSFHSAGHILGSAQIRIQKGSDVWVVSGDYKREFDPSCEPFEVVPCNTFITEATFGTPKFVWKKSTSHGRDIYQWWKENADHGRNSLLFGYSLGKSQRILAELAPWMNRPVVVHPSIETLTQCYRKEGLSLAPTLTLDSIPEGTSLQGELILAPPSILKTSWFEQLGEFETAFASGWMQGSHFGLGNRYDRGFVISDHADWEDLNRTIEDTQANQVFVLHRSHGALVRHLTKRGISAHPISSLVPDEYDRLEPVNLSLF